MAFNLSVTAQELNSAVTKANAAAPQSTTYTKNEVDTALSGKANTSDLGAAAAKGFDSTPTAGHTDYAVSSDGVHKALAAKLNTADVDAALSNTSTNPAQNKAVQAPIAELYEIKADKSIVGLKLVASNTMASSSTYTYAMNKNDFIDSSPDLGRSIGTYIISIMPWSTNPTYSLYAVSYTGGSFGYTTITKIAGTDMSITVANGVISVSGLPSAGGKISIHALQ